MYIKDLESLKRTSVFFMMKPVKAVYAFILVIIFSLIVLFIWALFAPMEDVVKADVVIRPENDVSYIRCITSGQLLNKNYTNSSYVSRGDLLFTLDVDVLEKKKREYSEQEKFLKNETIKYEGLKQTIEKGSFSEEYLDSDKDITVFLNEYLFKLKNYQLAIKETKRNLEREIQQDNMLRVKQKEEDLQLTLEKAELQYESFVNSSYMEVITTQKELRAKLNSVESYLADIERSIKNSVICAPIDGKVLEVKKLTAGDNIIAGEEILRIIPEGSEGLVADLYVDAASISNIKEGNLVRIKFSGLPPSQYGIVETTIRTIPPDVTLDSKNSYFIAQAAINSNYLRNKRGRKAYLLPGITGSARIITDKTTVLKMILKKLDFIN